MNKGRIIVSCTTTAARLRLLFYALESIKHQSLQPDKVLVNISAAPYLKDEGLCEVPEWVESDLVEVNWVENLGPYRKLLPTLEMSSDEDCVVTMDDDIIYGESWVRSLVERSREYLDHLISARLKKKKKTVYGGWKNYRLWPLIGKAQTGANILPTGGGGVLYRKRFLDLEFLTDRKSQEIAPTTDDLWFRMASLLRGTQVMADPTIGADSLFLSHEQELEEGNLVKSRSYFSKVKNNTLGILAGHLGVNETQNDRAWDRICEYANWPKFQRQQL